MNTTLRVNRSIDTWKRAYNVTLKTDRNFKKRLNELLTWDNCNGNTYERDVKIQALQQLLND